MADVYELELSVESTPARLDTNFEEIKLSLQKEMDDYKSIIVTEETLPGCRNAKKELVRLRNDLEKTRKEEKKKAEEPIKKFDSQCKELLSMIKEAETHLDEGISVYDNRVRNAKLDFAKNEITAAVESLGILPRFAPELSVLPEYGNKTASMTGISESVRSRAAELLSRQNLFLKSEEEIRTAVSSENETLQIKLNEQSYISLYEDYGWTSEQVILRIKSDAENLRSQEAALKAAEEERKAAADIPQPAPEPAKEPKASVPSYEAPPQKQADMRFAEVSVSIEAPALSVFAEILKNSGALASINAQVSMTGSFDQIRYIASCCRESKITLTVTKQGKI